MVRTIIAFMLHLLCLAGVCWGLDADNRGRLDQMVQDGRVQEAALLLLKVDPDLRDPEVLVRLSDLVTRHGLVDMESGDFTLGTLVVSSERLNRAHTQLLTEYPRYGALWLSYGNHAWMLHEKGDQAESVRSGHRNNAILAYETALQLKLSMPGIQERLGLLYLERGDGTRAVRYLKAALDFDPGRPELNFNLAWACHFLERHAEGLPFAEKAYRAALDPVLKNDARLLYGELLLETGKALESAAIFREAIASEPRNIYPLRRLVEAWLKAGNRMEAEKAIQAYLEKAPSDIEALGKLSVLLSQYDADDLLLTVAGGLRARYARTQPVAAASIGWLEAQHLEALGRHTDALSVLDKAIGLLEDSGANDFLLGELLRYRKDLTSSYR